MTEDVAGMWLIFFVLMLLLTLLVNEDNDPSIR